MPTGAKVAQQIAIARPKKASALADIMREYSIDAASLKFMSEDQWSRVAVCAGVTVPSKETKDLVVEILAAQERAVAEVIAKDPFARTER